MLYLKQIHSKGKKKVESVKGLIICTHTHIYQLLKYSYKNWIDAYKDLVLIEKCIIKLHYNTMS